MLISVLLILLFIILIIVISTFLMIILNKENKRLTFRKLYNHYIFEVLSNLQKRVQTTSYIDNKCKQKVLNYLTIKKVQIWKNYFRIFLIEMENVKVNDTKEFQTEMISKFSKIIDEGLKEFNELYLISTLTKDEKNILQIQINQYNLEHQDYLETTLYNLYTVLSNNSNLKPVEQINLIFNFLIPVFEMILIDLIKQIENLNGNLKNKKFKGCLL